MFGFRQYFGSSVIALEWATTIFFHALIYHTFMIIIYFVRDYVTCAVGTTMFLRLDNCRKLIMTRRSFVSVKFYFKKFFMVYFDALSRC